MESGDKLVHGEQGELVGPATSESHRGKGVAVRFPGNTDATNCYLSSVRRRRHGKHCHELCRRRRRAQPRTAPRRPSCPSSQPITRCEWAHR